MNDPIPPNATSEVDYKHPAPSSWWGPWWALFNPATAFLATLDERRRHKSRWILPTIWCVLISLAGIWSLERQPYAEKQEEQDLRSYLDYQVEVDDITQAQAQRRLEALTNFDPTARRVLKSIHFTVMTFFETFFTALLIWLMLSQVWKWRPELPFGQAMEWVGLVLGAEFLGRLVTIVMGLAMQSIHAEPSLGIVFYPEWNALNPFHRLFQSIQIFTIWKIALLALGVAAVTGMEKKRVFKSFFGLWGLVIVALFLWGKPIG
jgi:hypothetical protein